MSSTGRNLPGNEINALGAYDTPPGLCRAVVNLAADLGLLEGQILEPSVGSGNFPRALEGHQLGGLEVMDVDPLAPGLDVAHLAGHLVTTPSAANFDPQADARARARLEAMKVPSYRQAVAAAGFLVTTPQIRPDLVLGNFPYSVIAPRVLCPECDQGRVPGARGGTRKCPACNRWAKGKRPRGLPLGYQPERVIQVADLHVHRGLEVTKRHLVQVLRLPFLGGRRRFRQLWGLGHLRGVWTVVGRPSFAFGGTDSVETAVFWWDREWNRPTFEGGWITWEDSKP